MSVEENLRLGAARRPQIDAGGAGDRAEGLSAARRGPAQTVRSMYGGERQGGDRPRAHERAEAPLLDEPSGGLAPKFVEEIGAVMMRLKEVGTTMLMVEQNLKLALSVADRFLVLKAGRVSEGGISARAARPRRSSSLSTSDPRRLRNRRPRSATCRPQSSFPMRR